MLLVGSNPTEAHPVAALATQGCRSQRHQDHRCRSAPHRAGGLRAHVAAHQARHQRRVRQRRHERDPRGGPRRQGVHPSRAPRTSRSSPSCSRDYTPEMAEEVCGIPADDIRAVARLYGTAERASIVYCMGVAHHNTGVEQVMDLANLAMLTGNMGRPAPDSTRSAARTTCRAPATWRACPSTCPDTSASRIRTTARSSRPRGNCEIQPLPGLTETEMIQQAIKGAHQGDLLRRREPVLADPDQNTVFEALEQASTSSWSRTSSSPRLRSSPTSSCPPPPSPRRKARSPTPSAAFSAFARRSRLLATRAPTGRSSPSCCKRFDVPGEYSSPVRDLRRDGVARPDLPRHVARAARPRGRHPVAVSGHASPRHADPAHARRSPADAASSSPVSLHAPPEVARRALADDADHRPRAHALPHRHDVAPLGRLRRRSRRTRTPRSTRPTPTDSACATATQIEVSSRRGAITLAARVLERSHEGVVYLPFHWAEAPANKLTHSILGPIANNPGYKVAAVTRAQGAAGRRRVSRKSRPKRP